MNPLIIFDHIFFRIAYIYSNIFGYEQQKEYIGTLIVSLLQLMNVITAINFIKPLDELTKFDPVFIYAAICLVLIVLNLIRYYKFVSYFELANKRANESRTTRSIRMVYITSYFILTVFLLIYSSSYAKMT